MDFLCVLLGLIVLGIGCWGPWLFAAWLYCKIMDS